MKRKMRFNLYFEKEKKIRMRDIIYKDNAIKYLIKINPDLKTCDEYLNDINIKYNKLTRKDIKKEIDNLFFLYYNIYVSY